MTEHPPFDMYAIPIPHELLRSLEEMYTTFSIYHEEMTAAKRPGWMRRKTAAPCQKKALRELTREDLERVFQDASSAKLGDALDTLWVKALLPRQFELLLFIEPDSGNVEVDPSDATDFLPHLQQLAWERWSTREREVIFSLLMGLWGFALEGIVYESSVIEFLILLATMGLPVEPFIEQLLTMDTPAKALTLTGFYGGNLDYISERGWKAKQLHEVDYYEARLDHVEHILSFFPLATAQKAVRLAKDAVKEHPELAALFHMDTLHKLKRFFKRLKEMQD